MGISLPISDVGVTADNFFNAPESFPGSWPYPDPAPTNPSQYFISGER